MTWFHAQQAPGQACADLGGKGGDGEGGPPDRNPTKRGLVHQK